MNLLKAMQSFHQATAIRFVQKERTFQGRCAHHLQIQRSIAGSLIVLTMSQQSHNNTHDNIHENRFVWYRVISCDSVSFSDQVAPQRIHTCASKHILNSRLHLVPSDSIMLHFRCMFCCAKHLQDFFSLIFKAIFQKPHGVRIVLSLQKLREVELAQDVSLKNDAIFLFKHKNYAV